MMNQHQILSFMEAFTVAEAKARDAQARPSLAEYNEAIASLNSFASEAMANRFGMLPMDSLLPDYMYDELEDDDLEIPARIFRIDLWSLPDGRELAGCYLSQVGQAGFKKYFHLYVVEEIGQSLKIVRQFFLDTLDDGSRSWTPNGGDESIQIGGLPKPRDVVRLLEPADDADSMRLYLEE